MNIGIFTDCYYPQINGVVSSILMLREELIKRGHSVTIITVKVPGYTETSHDVIRINSIPFRKWKEFRLGVPFSLPNHRQIKALNLDLIHTQTEFSVGLLGKYMAKVLDIPLIHTYHTMYEDYSHYVLPTKHGKFIVKKFLIYGSKRYVKKFNAIIAPSGKTKSALLRYGVKNDIFIVPTGIKLDQFQQHEKDDPKIHEIRERLGLDFHQPIILSLGRISQEKSIDWIITQMVDLKKTIPDVKLLIVGDGPYKETLEALTHSLELDHSVIFTGRVPWEEVSYYYNMANVFVSASRTETQGLTIIEAMASKTPVVVYNDENIKDVVMDGISGRLFTTQKELTACLLDILLNIQTNDLTNNAYEIVQTLSIEKFGESAEKLYAHFVDGTAPFVSVS
ncbi:MAG: glycosyltransferase family 4 protein [Vallitaleaceae bacterium]|nr:glycosyltransferase family 4 protein [Vallitaleaceae bacterium]